MSETVQKENRMGTMALWPLLCRVSGPLMLSMLVSATYNVVDGIYVSWINQDALSATGLAYSFQMLMFAVAQGSSVGVNSLLSRSLGRRDFETVNRTAGNGIFLATISAVLFAVIGFFGSGAFIAAFSETPAITEMGTAYLQICTVGSAGVFSALWPSACSRPPAIRC